METQLPIGFAGKTVQVEEFLHFFEELFAGRSLFIKASMLNNLHTASPVNSPKELDHIVLLLQ
jgi:hypothetical protein